MCTNASLCLTVANMNVCVLMIGKTHLLAGINTNKTRHELEVCLILITKLPWYVFDIGLWRQ